MAPELFQFGTIQIVENKNRNLYKQTLPPKKIINTARIP
jgi:hypothetical protein